jgi:hypothetical protein
MWNSLFWKDVAERGVKTFAQAVLALLIIAPNTPVIGFDWPTILFTGLTAAVISVLTSIISAVGTSGTKTVSPASAAPDSRGI